jgi:hypothetical protein
LYSLNPLAQLPETTEEEPPDPTINWFESSTDFSLEEEKENASSHSEVDANE